MATTLITYGQDPRQYTRVVIPEGSTKPSHWVIFMHGGAWVDYKQTERDGDKLLESVVKGDVWGASIEYRLAPEIQEPLFSEDVYNAVKIVFDKYPEAPWTMIGHSAGAFHSLKLDTDVSEKREFASPQNVILSEGIYDLQTLVQAHPTYTYFTNPAFGKDQAKYDSVSPLHTHVAVPGVNYYIVHSKLDELVPFDGQPQLLAQKWKTEGVKFDFRVLDDIAHDDVFVSSQFCGIVDGIVQESVDNHS